MANRHVQIVPSGVTSIDASVVTTNATTTTIYTYTPSGPGRVVGFQFQVLAAKNFERAQFVMTALFSTKSDSLIVDEDIFYVNGPFRDNIAWDVDILNVTGNSISIRVTGEAATTINWRVTGTVTEHSVAGGGDPGA